ncbi:MAG: hypothetical protein MI863_02225, partial [Desulfobacterales bacterium]|nr:hypothetical protein [Desulfobacterales bacterium]
MKKKRRYYDTFFPPKILQEAFHHLETFVRKNPEITVNEKGEEPNLMVSISGLMVDNQRDHFIHDSEEEFFADYRNLPNHASYTKAIGNCELYFHFHNNGTDVH